MVFLGVENDLKPDSSIFLKPMSNFNIATDFCDVWLFINLSDKL